MSIFREYRKYKAGRDRGAMDRVRHNQKVRKAIKDNIADIISDEAIIGQSGDKKIRVLIRGIKEYRFIYGDQPRVSEGTEEIGKGDLIRTGKKKKTENGKAGNERGEDIYETTISLDELIEIMFEDLELPDMERKILSDLYAKRKIKILGTRKKGIRQRLDKKKTVINKLKRKLASDENDVPFRETDLRYKHIVEDQKRQSNAVVFFVMDTSYSMGTVKKYLARSFYFVLYQFLNTQYDNIKVIFIAHDVEAKEVSENDFFTKSESGGTLISSGYAKTLEIIEKRFHPTVWNIYTFHCSDGDNWESDIELTMELANKLTKVCNFFGYLEIKPIDESGWFSGSMIEHYANNVTANNFDIYHIEERLDIWRSFKEFLGKK